MPELPDLNVFASNLDKELSGRKVQEINVKNKSKLKVPVSELKKGNRGKQIKKSL